MRKENGVIMGRIKEQTQVNSLDINVDSSGATLAGALSASMRVGSNAPSTVENNSFDMDLKVNDLVLSYELKYIKGFGSFPCSGSGCCCTKGSTDFAADSA